MNLHQDDLKKRINRITATWRNGCFENMDDHTTPKHPLPKLMFSQKPFFSSNQQRRPLPFLPSLSLFYRTVPRDLLTPFSRQSVTRHLYSYPKINRLKSIRKPFSHLISTFFDFPK